jgi:hypothetical protein
LIVSLALGSRVAVASVLGVAALAKARDRRQAEAGPRVFGVPDRLAGPAVLAAIMLEALLAASLAAGVPGTPYAAAAFFAVGAVALARAIAGGLRGRPCGCFGARSRITAVAVGRAAALAVLAGAGQWLPTVRVSTQAVLAIGLIATLVTVAALTVAVLALAREVGELRLHVGPQAALELLDEGPEIGTPTSLAVHRGGPDAHAAGTRYGLAVFTSAHCPVCSALEPVVRLMTRDPMVELRVFDEVRDAAVWQELRVPGSPYAVVLDLDGRVLSKGTFNSLGQLESLLTTAQHRAPELALA